MQQQSFDLLITHLEAAAGHKTTEEFFRGLRSLPLTYKEALEKFTEVIAARSTSEVRHKVASDQESVVSTYPGVKVSYEHFREEKAMMQVITGDEGGRVVIETSGIETYAIVRRIFLPGKKVTFYVWPDRVVVATGLGVMTLTPEGRVNGGEVPPGIFPTPY